MAMEPLNLSPTPEEISELRSSIGVSDLEAIKKVKNVGLRKMESYQQLNDIPEAYQKSLKVRKLHILLHMIF